MHFLIFIFTFKNDIIISTKFLLLINYLDYISMTCRESEMRIVNEVTNSRVAWYSFMSLSVCIVVSALQITHLKRFFQKKKLI